MSWLPLLPGEARTRPPDERGGNTLHIINLSDGDETLHAAAASFLVDGFREHWPEAWPDLEAALEEVRGAVLPENICRAALDDSGALLGWIGGYAEYDGKVWELHPLVVRPDRQGRGVGRALVADFEALVAARGALTIRLGTDDEAGLTSISGIDLYPDPLARLAAISNLRRHPYEFYLRCGFAIVGVIPDANGFGKPDILMAKRVHRE